MVRVAIVVTLLGLASASPARSQSEGMPRGACLSSEESRNLFVADKLVQPFSVMRDASRITQAEAIDIQLCRDQGTLVYDVTLLNQQGRVFHCLINAVTGAAMPNPPPAPDPRPQPRPAYPGPRPVPAPYPAPDGFSSFVGPRFAPNGYGPRGGAYGYPAPRGGGPFFPGGRPGARWPGGME